MAGGADWSLIDLIYHWPDSNDQFVLYVNKTHEGLELLIEKMPSTVEVRLFDSLLEVQDKISKYSIKPKKNWIVCAQKNKFLIKV